MKAQRTYLEMRDPAQLSPARTPSVQVDIARDTRACRRLYRNYHLGVGAAYHWTDRADWTDDRSPHIWDSTNLDLHRARHRRRRGILRTA